MWKTYWIPVLVTPIGLNTGTLNINSYYVDGVSLTYGSPRKHIWIFITAISECGNAGSHCPCAIGSTLAVPSFIRNDYFCESESPTTPTRKLYLDPPWDGKNCGSLEKSCCQVPGLPWFHKTLQTSFW